MDAVLSLKMTEAASSMTESIINRFESGSDSVTTVDVVNLLFATSMVSANHMTNVRADISGGDTRFSTAVPVVGSSDTTVTNADGSTTTTTADGSTITTNTDGSTTTTEATTTTDTTETTWVPSAEKAAKETAEANRQSG